MRGLFPVLVAGSLVLSTAGCARGPGHGFGEIAGVTLDARYTPGTARNLGDGWALTDLGYRVHLDRFEVEASELLLEQLPGAGGDPSFDPANPPVGFTLCHGGHCHAEDGSVWTYEEIEAELAGGSLAWAPVVAFDLSRGLDLVAGAEVEWTACEPSCTLPPAHIQRVSLPMEAMELEARVRDDADGTTEWTLDLSTSTAGTWTGALDLPFDRDHDPAVTLGLAAVVDGVLLDGLDPAAMQPGGGPLLLDFDATAAVVANLGTTEIVGTILREPF